MLILLLVERTPRIEMVDATIAILPVDTLALDLLMMVVMASYVGQKIRWPATNLLLNERSGGVDWSLFH